MHSVQSGATSQVPEGEWSRFWQAPANLIIAKASDWHQIRWQCVARGGRLNHPFGKDPRLRLGNERNLHRPFEALGEDVVEPDRCREHDQWPAEHPGDPRGSLAETKS